MQIKNNLPHLLIKKPGNSESYSSPNNYGSSKFPIRNRKEHARKLLADLQNIQQSIAGKIQHPMKQGTYVEVIGLPNYDLKTESLDSKKKKVKLLNVRQLENKEIAATILVPNSSADFLSQRITEYRDKNSNRSPAQNPCNNDLVRSIEKIKLASFNSFYTDDSSLLPADENTQTWWEVWFEKSPTDQAAYISYLESKNIPHNKEILHFTDLSIILVQCSIKELDVQISFFDFIKELKRAKDISLSFYEMKSEEEKDWAENLIQRCNPPNQNAPAVCLLDTGVNIEHSLIKPALHSKDHHSILAGQNAYDNHGHGTSMAGLIIWGDLASQLLEKNKVDLPARLESVKLRTHATDDLKLFGNLTQEAVSKAAVTNPEINRVVCMALTHQEYKHRGKPSSWSAAVDDLAYGNTTSDQHLVILAAGNLTKDIHDYPNQSLTSSVQDPGQSWNAVTVGYYANKNEIKEKLFDGWQPLAPKDELGPTTTTSLRWMKKWPLKPEVVFEGGNFGYNPLDKTVDTPSSLQMLTLNHQYPHKHFNLTMETSAATALISRFAARIYSEYPNIWPEMVRALIIHSATWTEQMKSKYNLNLKSERESLIRTVGYGIPNIDNALKSASNNLNLLIQDKIFPFTKKGKMNELKLHKLPWPKNELEQLRELKIKMKITLSYFIEPDPNDRGWNHKYQYPSFGLRFQIQKPDESLRDFKARINAEERDENETHFEGDDKKWFLGSKLRSKGSIHSDTWEGTAAELASREHIAIYPTTGWWKTKDYQLNEERQARYALIISISTPSEEVDIYTLIENEVLISTEVST